VKLSYLIRGLPGHPLHLPLTDATIGAYTAPTVMGFASIVGVAALVGHSGYTHGAVRTGPYVLTLIGFAAMTVGGWLGGAIVFVYGMRVLSLVDEPAGRAASPLPKPERRNGLRASS
jgi:hypothetical protein